MMLMKSISDKFDITIVGTVTLDYKIEFQYLQSKKIQQKQYYICKNK